MGAASTATAAETSASAKAEAFGLDGDRWVECPLKIHIYDVYDVWLCLLNPVDMEKYMLQNWEITKSPAILAKSIGVLQLHPTWIEPSMIEIPLVMKKSKVYTNVQQTALGRLFIDTAGSGAKFFSKPCTVTASATR